MQNLLRCLIFVVFAGQSVSAQAAVFPGSISNMQQLKSRLIAKITKLDHEIEQIVYRTQNHKIRAEFDDSSRVIKFTKRIEQLHALKKELQARQKFIDQLIYSFTQHGPISDPHKLMPRLLYKMAVRESQSSQPDFKLVAFMTHLSRALRDLSEPHEDVFAFIESYMNFSTIQNPKEPSAYARNVRHYIGTSKVESVNQISVKTVIKESNIE